MWPYVVGWAVPDVMKDHGAFTLDVDALSSPSNTVLHPKELNRLDRCCISCNVTLEPTLQMTNLWKAEWWLLLAKWCMWNVFLQRGLFCWFIQLFLRKHVYKYNWSLWCFASWVISSYHLIILSTAVNVSVVSVIG